METIKKVICIEEGLLSFHKGETCYVISEDNSYYKLKGTDGLFSKCFFEDVVEPEPRLKVGDIVRGTTKGDKPYDVTNENMLKGEIIEVLNNNKTNNDIIVKVIKHSNTYYIGYDFRVNSKYFELYEQKSHFDFTPKGLRVGERESVTPKYPKVEYLGDGSKVVWNPPYTIIELNGNKGKSKCHPNDIYSELEGLKWALKDLVKK